MWYGPLILILAILLWRYSRVIASYVGRGPRFQPLQEEEIEGVSKGVRVFSVLLFAMFAGWCFVWVRSL